MRGKPFLLSLLLVASLFVPASFAGAFEIREAQNQNSNQDANKRKLNVPHRRHRRGGDVRRHKGIGHAYKQGGQSAGRGGKRFGKNIAHGKPIKGGKELGKGMGGLGKGVGKGTGRTGKKIGRKIKHAVTK